MVSNNNIKKVQVEIPERLYNRLTEIAKDTDRSVDFYVRESIEEHVDEVRDAAVALDYLEHPPERTYSLEETKKLLDIK